MCANFGARVFPRRSWVLWLLLLALGLPALWLHAAAPTGQPVYQSSTGALVPPVSAAGISFVPTSTIPQSTVQNAIVEVAKQGESYAAVPPLGLNSAIDAQTLNIRTLGIENAGTGNLLLNGTANPRITGCTTGTGGSGRNGRRLTLRGTHATKTVTIPTGNGLRMAGNTGSVVLGVNLPPVEFVCNEGLQLWEQANVPSAQQVYNVGRTVNLLTCGNALNPIWDGGGGTTLELCLDSNADVTWKVLKAGAAADSIVQLGAGKKHCVRKSDGTTLLFCVDDAGVVTGLATKPQMLLGGQNSITGCGTTYSHPTMRTFSTIAGGVEAQEIITGPRTIGNFWVRYNSPIPSGQTVVTTYLKNGVPQPLTCTIIQGSGVGAGEIDDQSCKDVNVAHTFSVVAGDLITVRHVCSGGSANLDYQQFSAEAS